MRKLGPRERGAILAAARKIYLNATTAEVGMRMVGDKASIDSREWPDDSDLHDTLLLTDVEVEDGYELDLYVYGGNGLCGNMDWTVTTPVMATRVEKLEPRKRDPLPSDGAYVRVNGTWPASVPDLTGPEALSAAKRMVRKFRGRAWTSKWKLTSGNRYTYPKGGVFMVNPDKGWQELVHDLSHYVFRKIHPGFKPHHPMHAGLEREMIEHVVTSGWLEGKLKREPKVKDPDQIRAAVKAMRYQRVCTRLKMWQTRARRADTAIKKLRKAKARYEKNQFGWHEKQGVAGGS